MRLHQFALFTHLSETLGHIGQVLAKSMKPGHQEGVPELFFFSPTVQAEWQQLQPKTTDLPQSIRKLIAKKYPALLHTWQNFSELLDDVLTILPASVDARRIARSIPNLTDFAQRCAGYSPRLRELSDYLELADDQILLVIDPIQQCGYRLRMQGIAEIAQLHVLFTEAILTESSQNYWSIRRPSQTVVRAYRLGQPIPHVSYSANFQLFRPQALTPTGHLPQGFSGSDHWLWASQNPNEIPLIQGERVILLSPPQMRESWAIEPKYTRLHPDLQLMETLTRQEVVQWLQKRCSQLPKSRIPIAA